MQREQNEVLRDFRSLGFLQFDVQGDFFFLRLKLFQAGFGGTSDHALLDSLHNVVDRIPNLLQLSLQSKNHFVVLVQESHHTISHIAEELIIRNNSPEMKELMEYMARHHDDLLKTLTDEQKEIFEKFEDCWGSMQAARRKRYLNMLLNSVCKLLLKH
ncbi:MAG: hypothetical protein E7624_08250 [Ruminococcaceae bacterium]|nr:hypothetical protein [Oscillospiraceae bacterium]